jgi:hypothetical protein
MGRCERPLLIMLLRFVPLALIELLFQDSEAYRLALKLYAGRYEVIACRDAADILREAIEKHMPDSDQQEPTEADTEWQASE